MAIALTSCSDSSGPTPGSFRAQVSGAHTAVLSGVALAEIAFGEHQDHSYTIRMHAESGDTVRTVAFHCRGEAAPAAGTYELSLSGEGCYARYNRVLVDEGGSAVILEQADATIGQLTVETSTGDQLPGTFSFSGPLVEGADEIGTVQVTGHFSATRLD